MMWHPDMPAEYRNQIVTGDARLLAARIPDNSCDLAFADPPYWVGFDYGGQSDAQMDYIEPEWLVREMLRVAPVAMITPSIGWMYHYPKPYWVVAWYKPAAMGRNVSGGVNSWEPILVYGKIRIDLDVITVPLKAQADASFHKCPKPIKLMSRIVEAFTDPGDVVVDFLSGSATTCKAAKMLGRNYVAFEIDPATAEKARQRVEQTQVPWFVEQPEQLALGTSLVYAAVEATG